MSLTNVDIAELLARKGEGAEGHRARAYVGAARAALLWDEEAADLVAQDRSLTELERIGPSLARRVRSWIEDEPEVPEPPPERRGFSSFARAKVVVGANPSWRGLRGDLQMHTVHSDGMESVEDMARAGLRRGYDYVAITDHSKGLKIAGGMDEAALATQGAEIADLNDRLAAEGAPLTVLRAIEMNVDAEGAGDMDAEALRGLDLVLGSFHSQLRRTEDQTRRYIAAVDNPDVHVIGHPRGRKFHSRLGLSARWKEVFDAAASCGKAVEIDSFPDRQDLDVELLMEVRDAGGWVSISTDAHNTSEMRFIDIGIAAAIRAGIARDRVLNYLTRDELLQWVARLR